MTRAQRFIWPIAGGLTGSILLTLVYFLIVSLAESPEHAVDLFWTERLIVTPLILGFGVQTGLYVILKKRLFIPNAPSGSAGALTGVGGTTSTAAMVACCAHHVADVLPILGMSAAATFLSQYQTVFMLIGLGTTLTGIAIMLIILYRARQRYILNSGMLEAL